MCVPSFLQAGPNRHPLPFTSGTVSVQDLTEAQSWAPVTSWEEFRWHWDSLHLGTRHTVPLVVSGQGEASVTGSSHVCPSRALLLGWRAWLLARPTSGLTPPYMPPVPTSCSKYLYHSRYRSLWRRCCCEKCLPVSKHVLC